ncbi:DNA polymerase I [candidate division WOR-1 bacterium RIFOXYA2_FULL_36_21]|uniref:DNA polymerase I n=1 Tax=candidate division WOR-1 bacterium RIFOXYB2_FULL_36_35 TaxID=1802578 RepID=A0A1F4S292_UNCSA|nr:MAG: DNA polymerase I [candidate division WOR-1 bacterium RIFOXYA2_FULL_36_21]OGC14565.1 MAG: DNA polymerase I [candidate division WOR-1 bacterium RIFOXYB2_FULL_36_35]OGC16237.1 MAG: DNA polymerase I [candidate division WOR-1 bacterium RIFOXYA12_FULL_36_13]
MPPKKAILIDGNSLAYRAFYALPDTMKNSEGLVTNAIYGFTMMLLKIIEENPDFLAIAFDRREPTFRHKEYKEYKAKRLKAPPSLYEQMPLIKEFVEKINIPMLELAGFEGDDVIGTLAIKASREGFNVEIVSGDLDPLQLVNDRIKVLTTRKGISDIIVYDEKAVIEKYGLAPTQLIDFKALKGDTSDNIPGMPGIGEKTATELLQKYGTLNNIFANADKIEKPKLKETLKNEQEKGLLSKRLGTIVTDAPIEVDFSKKLEINWDKAVEAFEKFEFKSLINKYKKKQTLTNEEKVEAKRMEISKFDFKLVKDESDLKELCEKLHKADSFAFDTETDSLDTFSANLIGISFSMNRGEAFYIPLGHKEKKNLDIKKTMVALKPVLENKETLKIGHNLKYDVEVLLKYDIEVAQPYFDTMVAAYLIDPTVQRYSLKRAGAQYLGRHEMIKLDELIGKEAEANNFAEVPVEIAKDYGCSDAEVTFSLKTVFEDLLKKEEMEKLFHEVEMPLLEVLIKMEETGVFVDSKELEKLSHEMDEQIKDLERNIFAISGETFNLNSPKQLSEILFGKLKLPMIKRTKTGASTDAEVLETLAKDFEIAEKLLEYRTVAKLKSTYVDALPTLIRQDTGRIHTSFNQTITATGRLSSSKPNLQNIPIKSDMGKKIREAFVPQKKGYKILAADYSQIELRVLAHLSQDENMIKAFKSGEDIHTATAAEIFDISINEVTKKMRSSAKAVNFGIVYGISDFGLAKNLNIKKTEAAQFIEKYFNRYPGVKKFMDKTIKEAQENGYVATMLGRKRPLPDINSPNQGLRGFAERTAINTKVQGTAADMIKIAMINIYCKLYTVNCKLILQVHDELVFEVQENEIETIKKIVQEEMEKAIPLDVPVVVDIGAGDSWGKS